MKKVIFFVTSLNSGGIENYLLRCLNFFNGAIKPIVLCKGNMFGDLEDDYKKIKNIELVKMKVGSFNSYFQIYSFFKKNEIDTVCDFTGNFSGIILGLAKLRGINNRIAFYRNASVKFKRTPFRLLYNFAGNKLVLINATKIFSNSKAGFNYFFPRKSQDDKRFKVIYNGIDATKFTQNDSYVKNDFGIPNNSFVIGHTGRFDPQKNHSTILKVAEILLKKHEDVYFMLCGKNTDTYLKSSIQDEKWGDRIKILGFRKDVNRILPVFDLFFFPSIVEGQPNSLIEAMVSGLPIVASNIDSIKETVPENLQKELINPLNVEGFCNRIEEYYFSKEKRENGVSPNWAKNKFSPDILFNQLYNEL